MLTIVCLPSFILQSLRFSGISIGHLLALPATQTLHLLITGAVFCHICGCRTAETVAGVGGRVFQSQPLCNPRCHLGHGVYTHSG